MPTTSRVAGVHAPAFVERIGGAGRPSPLPRGSPGFTPRPSLRTRIRPATSSPTGWVAGVHARPSLSVAPPAGDPLRRVEQGSPGFTPRPSLSVRAGQVDRHPGVGVAGVHAPAFVERTSARRTSPASARVGSPGFTPRPSLSDGYRHRRRRGVDGSPGFTPRPSLSVVGVTKRRQRLRAGRRGSRPGLR